MHRIMVVDDEENILKSLSRTFRREPDWEVECFSNAEDALRRARSCIFDAVISDCNMPGRNGIDFLSELREIQPDACRILITGMVNIDTLMQAINQASAFRFFAKPWDDDALLDGIREGLRYRDMQVENRMLAEKVRDQQAELDQYRQQRQAATVR
jgi:two-component system, probable response regulator PhcQ